MRIDWTYTLLTVAGFLACVAVIVFIVICGLKGPEYKVRVIDGCEYLVEYGRMAHKGNCKYCIERAKK